MAESRSKRMDTVNGAVGGLIMITGLAIVFYFNLSYHYFIGVIVASVVFGSLAMRAVPDMRKKENKNKNPYIGFKQTKKDQTVKRSNPNILRDEHTIMTLPLEQLSWREIEELCYMYFKSNRYKPRKTPEGADGGIDLVIFNRHHNTDIAIQIKHYKKDNNIGVNYIRELDSARKNYGCVLAEFITTSKFTRQARLEADKRKITCKDIEWFNRKVLPWREKQLMKKHGS